MVRCFLTACLLLPCFSSSALIGPNRVVSGQSRLLPDGGESLSSKNSFPTNASGRPVPTGLVPTGLDDFTSPLHCTPRAHTRLFAFACFASCSHCDRIGDCKVLAMLPCVVFLALLRLFCCQVRAVVAPSRAYACLIAFLFVSTCMRCDCVEVDACLNLVFCFVRGDVRCSGSCLAMILCFVVLAFCSLLHHHEQIMTLENSQEENLISCFTSGGGNARQFFLRCTTQRDAPVKLHYMLQCDAFFSSELASVFALFFCVHARQFLLRCEDCRLGCLLRLDLMW